MKSALATDLYQLTMMAGYERAGLSGWSTFELFVREMPPHRGYLVAAGIAQAVEYLSALRFTPDEIEYLRSVPGLTAAGDRFFSETLPSFRFEGDVWAMHEGEPVFAGEPMVRVRAMPPQAQLVETALLAIINFQTLIASKAARIVSAAAGRPILEFGTRRAHGLDAALYAARASYVAGCAGTSNVEAGFRFGIPISGTMAHSWVQSFPTEIDAFRAYLETYGHETTLLVDTYDTARAVRAIVAAGLAPAAVRLDSGDFGPLSREVRGILDAGGLRGTEDPGVWRFRRGPHRRAGSIRRAGRRLRRGDDVEYVARFTGARWCLQAGRDGTRRRASPGLEAESGQAHARGCQAGLAHTGGGCRDGRRHQPVGRNPSRRPVAAPARFEARPARRGPCPLSTIRAAIACSASPNCLPA